MSDPLPVIVIGGGGHAKVLIDLLRGIGRNVLGYAEAKPVGFQILGAPHLGSDDVISRWLPEELHLVNGIGSVGSPGARIRVFEEFSQRGYTFPSLVHASAVVSPDAILEPGVQVMAGAVIQAGCRIARNTIVNTRATIDHDCEIAAHAHIAPGATVSGGVRVSEGCHIGAGATIIQGLSIGAGTIVGAGAVVIGDVPAEVTVVGVPARILRANT